MLSYEVRKLKSSYLRNHRVQCRIFSFSSLVLFRDLHEVLLIIIQDLFLYHNLNPLALLLAVNGKGEE